MQALGLPLSSTSFYCLLLKYLGGRYKGVNICLSTGRYQHNSKWRLSSWAAG